MKDIELTYDVAIKVYFSRQGLIFLLFNVNYNYHVTFHEISRLQFIITYWNYFIMFFKVHCSFDKYIYLKFDFKDSRLYLFWL